MPDDAPDAGTPSSALTRWLSTIPSTVTPIVPPIDRRNATSELAAPTSVTSTVFCTARTRFCMDRPTPRPSTARYTPRSGIDVVWSMVESSDRPVVVRIAPATRKPFHRPYRLISWPDTVEAIISPPTSGRVSRPASVGA